MFRNFLSLVIAKDFEFAFSQIDFTCLLKLSFQSMVIPRSFTEVVDTLLIPLISNHSFTLCRVPRNII